MPLIAPGTVGRIGAHSHRVATLRVGASVNITLGTDPLTTDDTPTIAGYVVNPGGTIEGLTGDVYLDGVLDGQTSVTDATGFWEYTFASLANATYAIEVVFPVLLVSDDVSFTVDSEAIVLSALTMDNQDIDEGSPNNTDVGTISGNTAGSTLTLTNDAGGKFQIVETSADVWKVRTTATPTDYETATSLNIQVQEDLAGAANDGRQTGFTITVNNALLPPVNSVAPVVSGTETQGQTLSCTTGTWSNTPTSYTYQWKRDGSDISGATSSNYVLVSADVGAVITCAVTASNAEGAGSPATSNATGAIAAPPSWDFTGGSLPSGATFTRSSTATYFDSSGVMQTASVDAARFDYHPTTHASRGILIEPSKTNSILRSAELENASWTRNGASMTANAATAPDGTASGDKHTETGTTTIHYILQNAQTWVSGSAYTWSIFAKAAEISKVGLFLPFTAFATPGRFAWFNLATGAVGGAEAGVTAQIEDVGGGWYKLSITATANANVTNGAGPGAYTTQGGFGDSYLGAIGQGVYLWGAMVRTGAAGFDSYIPTTSAAVTRSADALAITVPSGATQLTYTFDDDSTQVVSVSPGAYSVPTNLNRPWIKTIVGS